jgi:hypothetical protein
VLYAALQPWSRGSSHLLIGSIRTTFLGRRREFGRRRVPRFLWRVQFFGEFREQPQFRRFGFARFISFARRQGAQFDLRIGLVAHTSTSLESFALHPSVKCSGAKQDRRAWEENILLIPAASLPEI